MLSFHQFNVQANMWDALNNLKTPQKWPVAENDRDDLYNSLAIEHDPVSFLELVCVTIWHISNVPIVACASFRPRTSWEV